jgi:hypothetical protein
MLALGCLSTSRKKIAAYAGEFSKKENHKNLQGKQNFQADPGKTMSERLYTFR